MSTTISPDAIAFTELMPLTVTIEPPVLNGSGEVVYDEYGAVTYGAAKTYQCYIDDAGTLIVATSGQQIISSGTIYLYPVATDGTPLLTLSDKARITLPTGEHPVILKTNGLDDEQGLVAWLIST